MTFQPYQEAAEEQKRQAELPLRLAKKGARLARSVATTGIGAAGGIGLLKILPFLNTYIPEVIARKGLAKILPKSERFFNEAEKEGHDFEESRAFLKEKLEPLAKQQPENMQEAMTMNMAKAKARQPKSELSRGSLMEDVNLQNQDEMGKQNLVQTMQEITQLLRNLRG